MLEDLKSVINRIQNREFLQIAGDESLLKRLPKGNWIGGTIPYFIVPGGGGMESRDKLFVNTLPDDVIESGISEYDETDIDQLTADSPQNGFTYLILPGMSSIHLSFAKKAPDFDEAYMKPVIGWVSGVALNDLGRKKPKTISGLTGQVSSDKAVAIHCRLPKEKVARIGVINLFKQGTGPEIRFNQTGFTVEQCVIGGRTLNFADYLRFNHCDHRLPLVADYNGEKINVSIQRINHHTVDLYAPVFTDTVYRFAKPVSDYMTDFSNALPENIHPEFSCNCILNYQYSELKGKETRGFYGPVSFGEIAYQLLNQTLVYLEIE